MLNPSEWLADESRDRGALAPLVCPKCETVRWFHLFEHELVPDSEPAADRGPRALWSLNCATCGFSMDLTREDGRKAGEFLPVSAEWAVRHAPEAEYVAELKRRGLQFIGDYERLTETWTCACGERSPLTFDACWSCGAQRDPAGQTDAAEDAPPPRTPELDKVMGADSMDPFGTVLPLWRTQKG